MEALESDEARASAWGEIELAWLQSLRTSLGSTYRLIKQSDVLILSTLDEHTLNATFNFVSRTAKRIVRVLDGVADVPEWGYDILIVFDDQDTYYRYVSRYYEDDGEFSLSGGMYINNGCGHFVVVKSDLRSLEPIIAHEMTHSYLGHLPIPAWLNEGIAVNTEYRLTTSPIPLYTLASKLGVKGLNKIDDAIVRCTNANWLKVARVIADAIKAGDFSYTDATVDLHARRVMEVVASGALESQGNLKKPRFSEVRVPNVQAKH